MESTPLPFPLSTSRKYPEKKEENHLGGLFFFLDMRQLRLTQDDDSQKIFL